MNLPSVTELIPKLQLAIGPVILISGLGLLLLTMTNRLGRAIDRARILSEQLRGEQDIDRENVLAQLRILAKRANLLRLAIILAASSALLAAILIIALFIMILTRLEQSWLIIAIFVGCMLTLIGSLVAFIQDINQALLALHLEIDYRG